MDQVDEVKGKTDIVQIIGERVELKKAGRNWKGLCPFHSEKTPSFMVNQELQIYKCFGCGEAGDVIDFLEKYEGLEFYEALSTLAERAGVKLMPLSGQRSEKDEVIALNELAAKLYHYIFTEHAKGKPAREYVFETRKLTKATVEAFKIGAAPNDATLLVNYMLSRKKATPELLERAGLAIRTERGSYVDRFRGRVIFPITDHRGRTIALAGRIVPEFDRGFAKYINSPQTPAYHKSDSVFGLNVTKDDIRTTGKVVVVEGELDLLSPWQAGVKNIVAIKGTAFTEGQLALLSRFTKNLTLALDSDFAGDKAAIAAIQLALSMGLDVKVVKMGKYKDPDDFVRADAKGFLKAVEDAVDVWEFIIDVIFARHSGKDGGEMRGVSRELTPILAAIEDKIVQAHYAKVVSGRLGVPVDAVAEQIEASMRRRTEVPEVATARKVAVSRRQILEERIVGLALQGDPNQLIPQKLRQLFVSPLAQRLFSEADKIKKSTFNTPDFIAKLPPELAAGAKDMYMAGSELEAVGTELFELLHELEETHLRERLKAASERISELEAAGDTKALLSAQSQFTKIAHKLTKLTEDGS